MLPWIIGGAVVLVGAALSASEENARKESKRKLQTKHRKYEKQYNVYAQKCKEKQALNLLKVLRHELKILQNEQKKVMQMLDRSPKRSKVLKVLEIKHEELLTSIKKQRHLIEDQKNELLKLTS